MKDSDILELYNLENSDQLYKKAYDVTTRYHGNSILLRGLIEYTNVCSLNCLYCGIRGANSGVDRYTLTKDQIINSVKAGYSKGLRSFVLQGGESDVIPHKEFLSILETIKEVTNNEAAITLSCGVKDISTFRDYKSAGADRYLLRFETSDDTLHKYIRNGLTLKDRLKSLDDLRRLDYQLGSGYMTGLPGESEKTRIDNALLARDLELDMVGIGPFIPHGATPLGDSKQEPLEYAIKGTALLRLLLPKAHIPGTTAAGSLKPTGREDMIKAGANVLMPNLTPIESKKDYLLYPGKICLDEDGSQCISCMSLRVKSVGREVDYKRGDALRLGGDK